MPCLAVPGPTQLHLTGPRLAPPRHVFLSSLDNYNLAQGGAVRK